MRRFRRWLRSNKSKRPDETAQQQEPDLPWLPAQPTPISSRSPQSQAAFFKLPWELRHQILSKAFGDGTVHMDLRYRPPLLDFATSGGREPMHGGYPPMVEDLWIYGNPPREPAPRDTECAWRWYSCRCHRSPKGFVFVPPFRDECLKGVSYCDEFPDVLDAPQKCQLGVMGFLLSCKQACADSLAVLYAKNTVYLASQPLIEALVWQHSNWTSRPRIMGSGIQLVQSLHMRWDMSLFAQNDGAREAKDRKRLANYVKLIPKAFPDLRLLYIIFEDSLYDRTSCPSKNLEEIKSILLEPLLTLRTNFASLHDFSIALPEMVFWDFSGRIIEKQKQLWSPAEVAMMKPEEFFGPWVWYPFEAGMTPCESRKGQNGYWVKSGLETSNFGWRPDGTKFFVI
ncbi:hypothetical protein HIM_09724 [Hirsutella minnesotensis 3608]|uniref:Uncharacterized protein n=1 Tax=Hirsutella minnesotensis 3608 TaxID=1043627 RepID=A0A0F8A2X9_9HYPO|nr:hypothetical protein HIM_09724 [Hirsutella minnesotensis 3608]